METRSWRRTSAIVAIVGLTLAACQAQAPAASTAPSAAAPSAAATSAAPVAKRGAGGDLKILYWQAPTILNPHQAGGTKDNDASRLILLPLASWDPKGLPTNKYAMAAEIPTIDNGGVTKDLTTVTWKLRPNVKWSDGTAFSADDVVFTWKYKCDKATAATTAADCDDIDSVTAKDPNTVVVKYKQANANYYEFGTGTNEQIIQQAQFKDCVGAKAKDCPANLKPIGTGPYKLTDFKPGDVVTYAINDNYFDPNQPFFKTVTIKGGGDATSAARAVCQTGDADYGWNLQVELSIFQPMLSAADSKCTFGATYNTLERVMINFSNPDPALGDKRSEPDTKNPALSDIHVRRALAMAANRDVVANQLYGKPGGVSTCNVIFFPSSTNTSSLDVCKYDTAAAEKELQDNGWVKGSDGVRAKGGVRLELNYQTSTNGTRQKTQDILKADWEKIGFKINLHNSSASTFFTNTAPDGYAKFYADLEEFANSQDPDPQLWLENYICSEDAGKANNWNSNNQGRYCNADYDKLYTQLKAETDKAKRDAIDIQMNDMLVKDVAMIPLVNRTAPTPNAWSKKIKGLDQSPFESSLYDVAGWSQ